MCSSPVLQRAELLFEEPGGRCHIALDVRLQVPRAAKTLDVGLQDLTLNF